MKNNLIIVILGVVIIGAGTFFGGMKYQQHKQPAVGQFGPGSRQGNGNQTPSNGNNNANRTGFRPVAGEIISNDDKSITVKLQDGSSKIVLVNDKTTINKADEATKEDLKVGEKVSVFGSTNADGSVTAQNIQLNPITRQLNQ